ncbi:MAG: SoxR reducing system RseC family protein [Anaerolineae bacterium]
MIEQQGRVLSADGHTVRVALGERAGCPACDAGRGCGAGLFGRLLRGGTAVLELESSEVLDAGDPVLVGIPERRYLVLVAALYGLPLAAGLAGAVAGLWLARLAPVAAFLPQLANHPLLTDLLSLAVALLAALSSLAWVRGRLPRRMERLSLSLSLPADGVLDCPSTEHH